MIRFILNLLLACVMPLVLVVIARELGHEMMRRAWGLK